MCYSPLIELLQCSESMLEDYCVQPIRVDFVLNIMFFSLDETDGLVV